MSKQWTSAERLLRGQRSILQLKKEELEQEIKRLDFGIDELAAIREASAPLSTLNSQPSTS